MIKYIGSKRTLVGPLGDLAVALGARTAVDLFTGTTRVARELKGRGLVVLANDTASYSHVLARALVAADAAAWREDTADGDRLRAAVDELDALPGRDGYVTRTFCEESRYFQPHNGRRIDAIRDAIRDCYAGDPLEPLLLASLLLAADRVDSTTGLQMAYLKSWAPRSYRPLRLTLPDLLPGPGSALCRDAVDVIDELPPTDLLYLDPPYNQHRYFTNYHVWETLVRWDDPEHYGIACKRVDAREDHTRSVFNSRRTMSAALTRIFASARADTLVVSHNDESWIDADAMRTALLDSGREHVETLAFDRKRYVGAQIGIHSPTGARVGTVGRLRNVEYVFVAGDRDRVVGAIGELAARTGAEGDAGAQPVRTPSVPPASPSASPSTRVAPST